MRIGIVLLAALSLRAQSPIPPWLQTLTKIRLRMANNLEHQPNYTCVETIERSSRPKNGNKLKILDTLRLEVAVVDRKEMFAWPGSKRFEDLDISKMVTTGAFGNGNFNTHAASLFTTNAARFNYIGLVDFEGKQAIRFDYTVPQMMSGYTIRVRDAKAIVAYHGSFYADPDTFDVKRIVVIAEDLPPQLMLSSASDTIDYAVARIGEGDFLLPSQSELSMIGLQGWEDHNHVKFASCREFTGESVVSFGEAPTSEPEPTAAPAREFDVPEGLEVTLALTKELDLRTAAIGDQLEAHVDRDVKHKGVVVIAKGATAEGRITRIERHENVTIVGVEFLEIDAPGMIAHMKATLGRTLGPTGPRRPYRLPLNLEPGEGLIGLDPTQNRVMKGSIMFWRT